MLDTSKAKDEQHAEASATEASLGRRLMALATPGATISRRRDFIRQVGLIGAAVLLYFGVRGLTQGNVDVAVQNGLDVLAFEARLGVDIESWAQELVLDHHWLVTLANWIYIFGHWPIIAATLIWLHHSRRFDYLLLRNAMFISGAIGLVIFATYAVAPPRLLDVGLADTVTNHSNMYRILQPPSLVNKYAAVPSLHVGWNLLIGISLFRAAGVTPDVRRPSRPSRPGLVVSPTKEANRSAMPHRSARLLRRRSDRRRRSLDVRRPSRPSLVVSPTKEANRSAMPHRSARLLKVVGVVSPVLMAITVVVTANHYVIDGVLGAGLALLGLALAHWLTPRMITLDRQIRVGLSRRYGGGAETGLDGHRSLGAGDALDHSPEGLARFSRPPRT